MFPASFKTNHIFYFSNKGCQTWPKITFGISFKTKQSKTTQNPSVLISAVPTSPNSMQYCRWLCFLESRSHVFKYNRKLWKICPLLRKARFSLYFLLQHCHNEAKAFQAHLNGGNIKHTKHQFIHTILKIKLNLNITSKPWPSAYENINPLTIKLIKLTQSWLVFCGRLFSVFDELQTTTKMNKQQWRKCV